ncbi:twin-arginine translocation pathway signal [Pollutimonas subterranea]|uniref:Twin-arginine translocation pathway signal n=1 Tax=Pollutimonas subterranea TaxID=2045210 RepID=A0A2N4U488_9BURK|nr:tripartite tricarboxylate transporter substrate binding protein [Pollutimonas subterranea]PLC49834.1 twin-arginine translocation pathway signal [Pollutimonas subterranea]
MNRRGISLTAVAMFVAAMSGTVGAESSYPSKPVRILVGYQPGGPTDLVARLVASKLQEKLGQPFVVENRPGAGSNIASEAAAVANPDGYTLLMAASPITMNGYVYKNQKYNVETSFEPITIISSAPGILGVSPTLPVNNLKELIELAKNTPEKLTFGSTGHGGSQHMAGELFQQLAGIELLHIPYKGASGVLTDLSAGHVDMSFMTSTSAIPFLETGKVKPLAVAGKTRLAALPDVPTFGELGYPGMLSSSWNALLAPAGTDPDIVKKLHAAAVEAVQAPDIKEKLEPQGAVLIGNSPEEFRKQIGEEVAHWGDQFKKVTLETTGKQ